MVAISGGSTNATPLPVNTETSVLAIGGTANGSVIYAVTADTVYVSPNHGATWTPRGQLPGTTSINSFLTIGNISVDAIDPSRVFIATNYGLYSSADGGQTWFLHESGLSTSQNGSVDATAVFVSPVNHLIVYAATAAPGTLYKSTDGGNNFVALNPTYPGKPQVTDFLTYELTLAPNGVDLLVVDSFGALLKSTDGGATWQKLGTPGAGTVNVIVDPANAAIIYALNYSGIQKSVDGGSTFTLLFAPLPPPQAAGNSLSIPLPEPCTATTTRET